MTLEQRASLSMQSVLTGIWNVLQFGSPMAGLQTSGVQQLPTSQ